MNSLLKHQLPSVHKINKNRTLLPNPINNYILTFIFLILNLNISFEICLPH